MSLYFYNTSALFELLFVYCMLYLLEDLIMFLLRCVKGLVKGRGVIVVKENVSKDEDIFDDEDSSVTRYCGNLMRNVYILHHPVTWYFPYKSSILVLGCRWKLLCGNNFQYKKHQYMGKCE